MRSKPRFRKVASSTAMPTNQRYAKAQHWRISAFIRFTEKLQGHSSDKTDLPALNGSAAPLPSCLKKSRHETPSLEISRDCKLIRSHFAWPTPSQQERKKARVRFLCVEHTKTVPSRLQCAKEIHWRQVGIVCICCCPKNIAANYGCPEAHAHATQKGYLGLEKFRG